MMKPKSFETLYVRTNSQSAAANAVKNICEVHEYTLNATTIEAINSTCFEILLKITPLSRVLARNIR